MHHRVPVVLFPKNGLDLAFASENLNALFVIDEEKKSCLARTYCWLNVPVQSQTLIMKPSIILLTNCIFYIGKLLWPTRAKIVINQSASYSHML